MVTAARLKKLLKYDPGSGVFTWLAQTGPSRAGTIAGCRSKSSTDIRVDGRLYRAHRLAWLYVHGVLPERSIDHINGDPWDNRLVNLRHVPQRVNMQNLRHAQRNNLLGLQGVSAWGKRFKARISIDGKPTKIGSYETPELAHEAYLQAKRKHHEGCTI